MCSYLHWELKVGEIFIILNRIRFSSSCLYTQEYVTIVKRIFLYQINMSTCVGNYDHVAHCCSVY